MCGICGYAGFRDSEPTLTRMADAIAHRGPDDEGRLVDGDIGLGARRLSIVDIAGGHQPLVDAERTLAIVFNGEIYNYQELREHLIGRGYRFRTRSDSETILHLYGEYGSKCVERLRGMFAFAIYDFRDRSLFIARDRLGIKPLYTWQKNGRLVFASEIKSILQCDWVSREPDGPSIDAYLSRRYVPGPSTMFRGIQKFPAGHWMRWHQGSVHMEPYWAPCLHDGPYLSEPECHERFAAIFEQSVRMRLMSERPLGAYLSGGLDSTCVVSAMAKAASAPVKTFTVGFDWEKDELSAAAATAKRLGCDHHEIICRPDDMALLPEIVRHADEPLGDAIVLPTYLLAREASRSVKVVLTGDGADEILAGYLFHRVLGVGRTYAAAVPTWLHNAAIMPLVRCMPVGLLDRFFDYPAYLGAEGKERLLAYLRTVHDKNLDAGYRLLTSLFDQDHKAHIYTPAFQATLGTGQASDNPGAAGGRILDRLLALQYRDWLPDNILMRQDKMSMAHGLEARVPYLDHKLVEFLFQVPPQLKMRNWLGANKYILRRYAARVLPSEIANRRKKAFYIPVERYANAPGFREILHMTLDPSRVRRRGYFDPNHVSGLIDKMDGGDFLSAKQVFALMSLELWHINFIDSSPAEMTARSGGAQGGLKQGEHSK